MGWDSKNCLKIWYEFFRFGQVLFPLHFFALLADDKGRDIICQGNLFYQ